MVDLSKSTQNDGSSFSTQMQTAAMTINQTLQVVKPRAVHQDLVSNQKESPLSIFTKRDASHIGSQCDSQTPNLRPF